MQKFLVLCICAMMFFGASLSADAKTKKSRGFVPPESAILVNSDTGEILSANAPDEQRHPASLTKMMTLYVVFEALEAGKVMLDQPLKVSARAARQPPSRVGLKAGSTIRLRDAISVLTTKSANDVAVVVAENLAGDEETFARWMTAKAHRLGMARTNFRNASGLHHSQQVTTARDMAVLARALVRNFPKYYAFFSLPSFSYNKQTFRNHNTLLRSFEGMDGLKTGFVQASGFNLAASAVRDGHRLIAVVMGGKTAAVRDSKVASLLNRGFASLETPDHYATVVATSASRASRDVEPEEEAGVMTGEGDASMEKLDPERKWSVQVGAFSSHAGGMRALRLAYESMPQLLKDSQQVITSVKTSRHLLYRAKFSGLTSGTARAVCAVLSDCLVLQQQ
ncbi:MAG TPA: D-alanyl-D-alanine carboxypeptidase [Rhodospirillaceae bacterium]|nr:MAG: hypothetical protein A2018_00800 [Alphaproteobacteria bacterium GWF2_58_20]HAU28640.1 D-alanyl-D-alanine carboxypeptidase [Rhodospirillaceae bacterium]